MDALGYISLHTPLVIAARASDPFVSEGEGFVGTKLSPQAVTTHLGSSLYQEVRRLTQEVRGGAGEGCFIRTRIRGRNS
jgi:hypothetical protein